MVRKGNRVHMKCCKTRIKKKTNPNHGSNLNFESTPEIEGREVKLNYPSPSESVLLFLVCCDPDKRVTTYGHMQVLANLFLIDFSYKTGAAMGPQNLSEAGYMSLPLIPTVLLH